jgi:hypothetical protein
MAENGDKPDGKQKQQDLLKAPVEKFPIDPQCKGVLDRIEKDLANLQPTPKLGRMVGWVQRYARTESRPGMPADLEYRPCVVFRRLSPGRVDLAIQGELAMPVASGAQWIAHPSQLKDAGNKLGPGGAWFYLEVLEKDDWQIPAKEFEVHKAALEEKRQKALEDNRRRYHDNVQREALAAQYRAQQAASGVQV